MGSSVGDVDDECRPTTVVTVGRPDDPVSHRLADQVWPTVAEAPEHTTDATGATGSERAAGRAPVLIVPIGACEQHGPHLPIGTDSVIAEELSGRLAAALDAGGRRVWIAPPIAVTASGEHHGFAGTLSIGTAAMHMVVVELVRSATWATAVILVNGHGGNREAVDAATAQLVAEGHRVLSWWPSLPDDLVATGDLHAGYAETSIMLALVPERVDQARATAGPTAVTLAELRAGGIGAVSPSGVLGDPQGATATAGTALLEVLATDLVVAAAAFLDRLGADRATS